MLDTNTVHQVEDGRVYFAEEEQSWFFVYEGTFLTSLANNDYDDMLACNKAHPQTQITEEQAQAWVDEC